jgi:acetoacetate decarboxylase
MPAITDRRIIVPRTRYTRSPEDVARFQDVLAAPSFFDIQSLSITFDSDPDVLAELIPPPLRPADRPRVSVGVNHVRRSNCVGAFHGAGVNIACTYEGEEGTYCLTMPMSTDTAVIFGRELFAEPKKLADITLALEGQHARGTVTRHGITYIDLGATLDTPLQPAGATSTSHHYYFKFLPAANGRGLAHDPELIRVTHRLTTHQVARGTGTITFRESVHDPVIDVPVLSVTGAAFAEVETLTTAEVVATVPVAQFLPYAYGKMDDITAWATAGLVAAGGQ